MSVLAAALCCAVQFSGCGPTGGSGESASTEEELPRDTLAVLSDRVDSAFLRSITAIEPADSIRRSAFDVASRLAREILTRERPVDGWTPEDLTAAFRDRKLAVELEVLDPSRPLWLLRIADPLRPVAVGRSLLIYEGEGVLLRLPEEPFRYVYETASWRDSLGDVLAVTGWSRSRPGMQPTVWVFRLPENPTAVNGDTLLSFTSRSFLSNGRAGSNSFVRRSGNRAPTIRITEAALANRLFDECANCPHLEADLLYRYVGGRYVLASAHPRRTPYAAFAKFIDALLSRDYISASAYAGDSLVIDLAREHQFDRRPARGRWRIAPGSSAASLDQIYLRGDSGAFRILLSVRDSNFVVTSISPTDFIVD